MQNELTITEQKYFAVSREFAKTIKEFTKNELKTLYFALTKVNYKAALPDTVTIKKRELAAFLGLNSDDRHFSENLYAEIKNMRVHSSFGFVDVKTDTMFIGGLIDYIEYARSGDIEIKFSGEAMKYFGNLINGQFILMLANDIESFSSVRSIILYEFIRAHSDTRVTNTFTISTKALKTMFRIPQAGRGSYMTNGHFQRALFEERVLNPICRDLSKCSMIKLIIGDNGYYTKVKNGPTVQGYKFTWTVNSPDENGITLDSHNPFIDPKEDTVDMQDEFDESEFFS